MALLFITCRIMSYKKFRIKKHFESLKSPYAGNARGLWKFIREREKSAFHKIAQSLSRGNTVLDIGSGSCEYAKILLEYGAQRVDCVDFTSLQLKESSFQDPRLTKITADAEKFEATETYHLILCAGLLEFLDQPENFPFRLKKKIEKRRASDCSSSFVMDPRSYLHPWLSVIGNSDSPPVFKISRQFFFQSGIYPRHNSL